MLIWRSIVKKHISVAYVKHQLTHKSLNDIAPWEVTKDNEVNHKQSTNQLNIDVCSIQYQSSRCGRYIWENSLCKRSSVLKNYIISAEMRKAKIWGTNSVDSALLAEWMALSFSMKILQFIHNHGLSLREYRTYCDGTNI
jgi:hypothetical protein